MRHISFNRKIKTGLSVLLVLLMVSVTNAQSDTDMKELEKKVERSRRSMDSLNAQIEASSKKMLDSINAKSIERMTENSVKTFAGIQSEQRKKQKQKAIMYLCFGAAGFGVLIYSFLRKKKKPVS